MITRTNRDIVQQLARLALALTAEKSHDRLLDQIMQGCLSLTNADAGTLYTLSQNQRDQLEFTVLYNKTLGINQKPDKLPSIPLYEPCGEPSKLVVVQTFLQQSPVNIPDVYHCDRFDFSGTRRFDEQFGYRSKSFLCVPLQDHEGEMIGVLQLINALDENGEIQAFSDDLQLLIESLSSMAATVLTKRKLIEGQRNLLESFIKVIARAIDHKSPVTGKHCENIPAITQVLAQAVCDSREGPFSEVQFTDDELYELQIASWLHDCGKITTPEHVIEKATKLQTIFDRIELVAARFTQYKQHLYIELLQQPHNDAQMQHYQQQCRQLDSDLELLRRCNRGSEALAECDQQRIQALAGIRWTDCFGQPQQLISDNELNNLLILRGTLTEAERNIMRDHIIITQDMLEALSYPSYLQRVPEIAGNHHECIDGSGYPKGLQGSEMSLRARIMCIADIFEALTSPDRPYKKGMKLSQAFSIMGRMVEEGKLDGALFRLFVESEAYLNYARSHIRPEQIDPFDPQALPGMQAAEATLE
ncbi:HD domain-containing phosphohydrolase [Marinobacterium jannaschii]|uniref:HD domain-containing phosphohydrolase n=1 Tax=Marinobacterium jannaschii TaxID=64970 RepID=UPI000481872C|nr:HD domain-containing phosphohydrolase [Marinobacterium jannaschii]